MLSYLPTAPDSLVPSRRAESFDLDGMEVRFPLAPCCAAARAAFVFVFLGEEDGEDVRREGKGRRE